MTASRNLREPSYKHTAEAKGLYYRLWLLVWPVVHVLIRMLLPGPLGLKPPGSWFEMMLCNIKRTLHYASRGRLFPMVLESAGSKYFSWWKLFIWGLVRRVLGSGRGEVTAVGHIVIAILIAGMGFLWRFSTGMTFVYGVLFLVGAFTYGFGCLIGYMSYIALRALTPEEYAKVALAGKLESDVFKTLAYEMQVACKSTTLDLAILENHRILLEIMVCLHWLKQDPSVLSRGLNDRKKRLATRRIEGLGIETQDYSTVVGSLQEMLPEAARRMPSYIETITANVRAYDGRKAAFEESLQRLLRLKEEAARMLGVPRRRLCEHILQYSPIVHRELSDLYSRLWWLILEELSRPEIDFDRIDGYLIRCEKISGSFLQSALDLDQLFKADEFLRYVHRISSRHSTSGAVLEYAKALSDFSRSVDVRRVVRQQVTDLDRAILNIAGQLRFFYSKQRAYPGVDVHETCLRVCKQALRKPESVLSGADTKEDSKQRCQALVSALNNLRDDPNRSWRLGQETAQAKAAKLRTAMGELADLSRIATRHIGWSRVELGKKFCEDVRQWLEPEADVSNIVILTHGYSKTVREALIALFLATAGKKSRPKAIVIDTPSKDEDDPLNDDARKLVYEINADVRLEDVEHEVANGNERSVMELLGTKDKLLIVLGAECFDQRTCRAIHPRGVRQELGDLKKNAIKKKVAVRVYVVAEEYKEQSLDDLSVLKYHLDRLDVYDPELIDVICTDERVIPIASGVPT